MVSASVALVCSGAGAQTLTPIIPPARPIQILSGPATIQSTAAQPLAAPISTAPVPPTPAPASPPVAAAPAPSAPMSPVSFPPVAAPAYAPGNDSQALETALSSARRGDAGGARAAMQSMSDPAARKIALWAMVDADGEQLSFFELDQARRELVGWPRASRRQAVAEKALDSSGLPPAQVIAWFGAAAPATAQGAMALASAYQLQGRVQDAQALIRHWWRTQIFEADVQRAMLNRFGGFLTIDDHVSREDTLLYGVQGPAAHDMLALLPPDQQALAQARIALRSNANNAMYLADTLPPSVADDPGLAVERARSFHDHDMDSSAIALVAKFPQEMPCDEAASRVWTLRKQLINASLKTGDYRTAYTLADKSGLTTGVDYTEAEFYAGWLALSKLHEPALADAHFANIQNASSTPISQARALYWRGRAAEADGDQVQAKAFYAESAHYYTTFYGQLAAEKVGLRQINIGRDPVPTPADVARFEGRDVIRAARLLAGMDERDTFRLFVLAAADDMPTAEESTLLVDLARNAGEQDLSMRVVRAAAQRGVILPERGYPIRATSLLAGTAEPAIVFGLTRQESNFDPHLRSNVGARGMMQLLPGTAEAVARKIGEPYSAGMLDDADYNMRLGSFYIGSMIDNFGGSYVLATAAYNAGPGRPAEWVGYCGDPRSSSVDPVDFIECIPFSETRNYVMRVMEAAEIYRARLNGGVTTLNLTSDLKRGGYVYGGRVASVGPTLAAAPIVDPGR
ncbi:MAG TPA: lytic transglycosylase domain-containing protein [Caulobacteraceae bacterium]|nr:lytic transglycosylase domain-containing protein [Caulobacteraceae bacterium]